MKKILITLLIFLSLAGSCMAQTVDTLDCDVPDRDTTEFENLPWFGNNDYLENFLDSIGYSASGGGYRTVGPERVRFHVPVKFWIYRNSSGVGGPSLSQLQNYIDNLNHLYNVVNNTLIGFYMRCEIGYIDDDSHVNVETDAEAFYLVALHKEGGCINIHIANNLYQNTVGVQIRARAFGIDGIFLNASTYLSNNLRSTIAHEVGHYFELDHTHQYSDKGVCRREAIDRDRTWPTFTSCIRRAILSNKICETTGDGLRDTQADPDLSNNDLFGSCDYLLGGNDLWGDSYTNPPHGISEQPNTHNILSYNGNRNCRDLFSRLQIAVMLHSLYRGKSSNNSNAWMDSRGEYDEYEMDNFSEAARPIVLNELQQRNFNQQYYGNGVWGQCDVDWVQFTPTCNGTFDILTSENPGRINANTRLTLFDANINQLDQNDDISSSNLFSKITYNFIAGQTYFIRVENMSTNVTGYYNLSIGPIYSITGNPDLCGSGIYSVDNLPAGATVTWSASPTVVNFNPNPGNPTTVTANGGSATTLIANILSNCGNATITKSIQIAYPPSIGVANIDNLAFCNEVIDFQILPSPPLGSTPYSGSLTVGGASNYSWALAPPYYNNGVTWFDVGNGTVNLSAKLSNASVRLRVTGTTPCGSQYKDYTFNVQCIGISRPSEPTDFMVSPNPASSNLIVEANKESSKKSIKQIAAIELINKMGRVIVSKQFASGITNIKLPVGQIPNDVYTLRVFDGLVWSSYKIIIQH